MMATSAFGVEHGDISKAGFNPINTAMKVGNFAGRAAGGIKNMGADLKSGFSAIKSPKMALPSAPTGAFSPKPVPKPKIVGGMTGTNSFSSVASTPKTVPLPSNPSKSFKIGASLAAHPVKAAGVGVGAVGAAGAGGIGYKKQKNKGMMTA